MRTFEVLTILSFIPILVFPFVSSSKRPRWWGYLALLPIVLALLQFVIEGYVWQMIPAYVLSILVLLANLGTIFRTLMDRPLKTGRRWLAMTGSILGILIVALGGFLIWAFPVVTLPAPTGSFAVGTQSLFLTDDARDSRRLAVQLWYPGEADGAVPRAPYIDNPQRGIFLFNRLTEAETHSYLGLDVAAAQPTYPVLIFSHGGGSHRFVATYLMEELASHGYFVFSIGHTGNAPDVTFPDGTVEKQEPDWPARGRQATRAEVTKAFADDQAFVWQEIQKLNTEGDFAGRMDLAQLGSFGYSQGGAAAPLFCSQQPDCDAALNIDGSPFYAPDEPPWWGEEPLTIPQPYMMISEEALLPAHDVGIFSLWPIDIASRWTDLPETEYASYLAAFLDQGLQHYEMVQRTSNNNLWIRVNGTSHGSFGDAVLTAGANWLFAQFDYTALTELNEPERNHEIARAYVLAFFDTHLKDQPSPLLAGAVAEYPEVAFVTDADIALLQTALDKLVQQY